MILNNIENTSLIQKRLPLIEKIFKKIPAKYVFISGSFLYKEKYNDIDVFVVSRNKSLQKLNLDKKINLQIIDFNQLHSLFYHSVSKSCIAKNFLPKKDLKVTISRYWMWINESVPNFHNQPDWIEKDSRSLIMYTEYLKNGKILSSEELTKKCKELKNLRKILDYINNEVPFVINKSIKKSYLKRFFYTIAGFCKENLEYDTEQFLLDLVHKITRGEING